MNNGIWGIKKEIENITEAKEYHTHSLRHTSATLLYNENNTDILVIKEILGHSSLATTEIYTHVSNQKLKEIMENYSVSIILEKRKLEVKNNGWFKRTTICKWLT